MIEFFTPQTAPVVEEAFQTRIIEGMSKHLLSSPLPALLRAPTGSGKTLMMGRVLEKLCQQDKILWLWFVPFVNLVQQTEEAISANCHSLKPYLMAQKGNMTIKMVTYSLPMRGKSPVNHSNARFLIRLMNGRPQFMP